MTQLVQIKKLIHKNEPQNACMNLGKKGMHRIARKLVVRLLLGLCCGVMGWGCASGRISANATNAKADEVESPNRKELSRRLSSDAVWQDMVDVLLTRGLENVPPEETQSCILEGFADGSDGVLRIPAVLPSTENPTLLGDDWLETKQSQQADLLTPWGTYNSAKTAYMFYPLTPLPRELLDEPMIPMFVIEESQLKFGAIFSNELWSERKQSTPQQTLWPVVTAEDWPLFQEVLLPGAPGVLVTAKRDVSVQRIREVFEKLQGTVNRIALVVAVKTNANLKGATFGSAPRSPHTNDRENEKPFCTDDEKKFPPKPIHGRVPGWFNYDGSTDMHQEFKTMVHKECGSLLSEHESGVMHVVVRINKQGRAEHVCVSKDTVDNTSFRECALKQIDHFPFPSLSRGDYLQFDLVSFFFGSTIRPLCE